MKNISSIIWGLVLVAVGVILGGNAMGWFNIDVFFDGWWTLFIIVPCAIGFVTEPGERIGHLIGLAVGVFLLLGCLDVLSFDTLWKLVFPIVVILVGLCMIFKNVFSTKFNESTKKLNEKINKDDEVGAVFGGQNVDMNGEEFKGRNINAVFGGVKFDLRKAKIKEDAVINASAIFGGIDILVPDDVVVVTKSNSLFGGVSNKKSSEAKEGAPTIYVNGMAIFGGVEIK